MPEEPNNTEEYNDEESIKTIEIDGDSIKEIEPETVSDNSTISQQPKAPLIEPKQTPPAFPDLSSPSTNSEQTQKIKPRAVDVLLEKTSEPIVPKPEMPKVTEERPPQGVVFEQKNEGVKEDEDESSMKLVRTYQADVVETMKKQKSSLTSMVLAEKEKQKGKPTLETKPRKIFDRKIIILIVSTLIILVVGYFGYQMVKPNTNNPEVTEITEQKISTLILPNYKREIYVDRIKRDNIVNALKQQDNETSIPLGYVIQFYLTTEDASKSFIIEGESDYKLLVTTESFFDGIEAKIPDSLIRNLGQNFIIGYHSSLGNNPFLILEVKSYNNAFAGMMDWEKTMFRDLSPTFVRQDSSISLDNNPFQDIVVSNKDVRAILNEKGKIELAYSFPNPETLIIANNETTLQEIYRRVTNARLERKN